jgi:hypothetical protein
MCRSVLPGSAARQVFGAGVQNGLFHAQSVSRAKFLSRRQALLRRSAPLVTDRRS